MLVIITGLISIVKFFVDVVAVGSRDRFGSFLAMACCVSAAFFFVKGVFYRPYHLKGRQFLKYGVLGIMIANFVYGLQYVSDHIRPQVVMIFYCLMN